MADIELTQQTFRIEDGIGYVGSRPIPWAEIRHDEALDWKVRGLKIPFENGFTLSVQWGAGTYSMNHDAYSSRTVFVEASPDAEIAVWDSKGDWVQWAGDDVKGWVSPEQVLALIDHLASPEFDPAAFRLFCGSI